MKALSLNATKTETKTETKLLDRAVDCIEGHAYGVVEAATVGVAGLSGSAATHVSESGLSLPADYVIDNNGTLEELHEKFDAIVFGAAQ